MSDNGDSSADDDESVDLGRFGDWTTWSSLLVLLVLAPSTALCLTPFVWVASEILPGGFWLWMLLYFAAFAVALIPGLEFLQVWLVCPDSRKPTPEELAWLMPSWDRVLSRVGKAKRRRYRLRVSDDLQVNAAAGGGSVVIVTTGALRSLPENQLEAVLAHEFGHHVGLHPVTSLVQYWMGKPFEWAERLSVAVHNLLAWLSGWRMHPRRVGARVGCHPGDQGGIVGAGCRRHRSCAAAAVPGAAGRVPGRCRGHQTRLRAFSDRCSRRHGESARICACLRRGTRADKIVLGYPSPNS